jgi:hypoxanthine phosphoribosyltransferase
MQLPSHIRDVYKKARCLYTTTEVNQALEKMADAIQARCEHSNPIILCVMVGGLVPLGNLLPRLNFPLEVDYVHATRYQGEIRGGELKWLHTPTLPLQDRCVVIVDDILDGGVTLKAIIEYCEAEGATEVLSAVLVEKKDSREQSGLQQADFSGMVVDNHYVFGYGMDYKGYLRNAPGVYVVAAEHES